MHKICSCVPKSPKHTRTHKHTHTCTQKNSLSTRSEHLFKSVWLCPFCMCACVGAHVCVTASKLATEKCCVFSPSKFIYPQNLCCVGPLTFFCVSLIIFNWIAKRSCKYRRYLLTYVHKYSSTCAFPLMSSCPYVLRYLGLDCINLSMGGKALVRVPLNILFLLKTVNTLIFEI